MASFVGCKPELTYLTFRIKDNEAAVLEACYRDLGKGPYETSIAEIDWCTNDIVFVTKNLRTWAKDEGAPDMPFANKLISPKIRKDPLGAVLIIGYDGAHTIGAIFHAQAR